MLEKLINDIEKDIYDQNIWGYVKLQSLVEKFAKKALKSHGDYSSTSEGLKTLLDRLTSLCRPEAKSIDFNAIYKLNHIANQIKHGDSTLILEWDEDIIRRSYFAFNDLISLKCFESLGVDEYYLNPGIFEKPVMPEEGNVEFKEETSNVFTKTESSTEYGTFIINCGVGKFDYGFTLNCTQGNCALDPFSSSVYATIFNFLQKSTDVKKPTYLSAYETRMGVQCDYQKVYRWIMLILVSMRFGARQEDGKLKVNIDTHERSNVLLAADIINNYSDILSGLCKHSFMKVCVEFDSNGPSFSISGDETADYYATDIELNHNIISRDTKRSLDRSVWHEANLRYSVVEKDDAARLKELLQDLFGYTKFRPGQCQAIAELLNGTSSSVCIMPTGSGKSLVFYMVAMLSASPTIVIVPTEILVKDQLRNLHEVHGIDDCIMYSGSDDISVVEKHKLIYMQPKDLQSYYLLLKLIGLNHNGKISNIILDEIHTLSNWSHDFRPDYLMLTKNMISFMDRARYIGFTATANIKVIDDIVGQLRTNYGSVIQPVGFKLGNFSFEYISCDTYEEQLDELLLFINQFIANRERSDDKMIVFTCDYKESQSLTEQLRARDIYETSCFDEEYTYSYRAFTEGTNSVLIAGSELGVGINLPNIVCAVHFGIPKSKAQYVQEIGRANRKQKKGRSVVIFNNSAKRSKIEERLLSYTTSIDEIQRIIYNDNSYYSRMYRNLLSETENYYTSANGIYNIFSKLSRITNYTIEHFRKEDAVRIQKYLYKLHLMGIIENWYIKYQSKETISIQIEMDFQQNELSRIKEHLIDYFSMMGQYGKYVSRVSDAKDVRSLILLFEEWFNKEFLRYHRDQLIGSLEFFNYHSKETIREDIIVELSNFFSTSVRELANSESMVSALSVDEIFSEELEIDDHLYYVSEQNLALSYDAKDDLVCSLYKFNRGEVIEPSRIIRIFNGLAAPDKKALAGNIYMFYDRLDLQGRLNLINMLEGCYSLKAALGYIFSRLPQDEIYLGYIAREVNKNETWRKLCLAQ